jgi:hypothetical protein
MASMGGVSFEVDQRPARTGVACELLTPLTKNLDFRVGDAHKGWSVRGLRGGRCLVASCREVLSSHQAKKDGLAAMFEVLDLACIQENVANNLARPSDDLILLLTDDGKTIVEIDQTIDFPIGISVKITILDRDGNPEPEIKPAPPRWHRSLRYYRLSQIASDVYEAYRSLYLGFESLVESLYPRGATEREGEWIRRVFMQMNVAGSLAPFAPAGHKHPNEYLFGVLYESTRCNLFHARTPDAIIPYYQLDTSQVGKAYDTLLRIWRIQAAKALGTANGGAVVTYAGFRLQMDTVFQPVPLRVEVTEDDSQSTVGDETVSPRGMPVTELQQCRYGSETAPGVVTAFIAEDNDAGRFSEINRIGLMLDRTLFGICHVPKLRLDGIDVLRLRAHLKLVQKDQPRTMF